VKARSRARPAASSALLPPVALQNWQAVCGLRISELLAERQAQNAEARVRAVEEAQISASRLAAQFARAYQIAEEAKKPEAMVNATVAQAKFAGLWVERSEVAQTNEFAGLSLEDMRRELVERARRLGLDRHLAGLLEGPDRADDHRDIGDGELN
jgi:hypothetical protein